jgi:hypothetical protein
MKIGIMKTRNSYVAVNGTGTLVAPEVSVIKSSRAISCVKKLKLAYISGTETVLETSASFSLLTRLIAREDFLNSCHHESFKS